MASYPTSKVHRISRRKLGKNQFPSNNGVGVALTDVTVVLTMTFSRPVVVTGIIPVIITTGSIPTFVSQTIVSPNVVTQTFSATLVGHTVTVPGGAANVATYQGGQVIGQ